MTTAAHEFTRYAGIGSALADPRLVPLPAEPSAWRPPTWRPPGASAAGSAGSAAGVAGAADAADVAGHAAGAGAATGAMAWLRTTAARFSSGETHARRRALVEADCARLDPAALRLAAAADTGSDTRQRVVAALAAALGIAEPGAGCGIAAANRDQAVFTDPDAFDPGRYRTGARLDGPDPAAPTGRPARPGGEVPVGPDALTFGAPPRLCPGRRHALALAAGVLEGDARTGDTHSPGPGTPLVPHHSRNSPDSTRSTHSTEGRTS
ncbi:hypothetical protein [Kitasatospora indigofera]|uniref:hypothetical protein n=1 Tax=Kitasatospora indigofera TaxID=67307 RepID=UPI00339F2C16